MDKKAIITERIKGLKDINGSQMTVNVDVPVIFADTTHSRIRQGERSVDSDTAISLVKQALPEILSSLANDSISKIQNGDAGFTVVDKQSCAVIGCTMKTQDLKSKVIIRTVYVLDQYHQLDNSKTIFYLNEDNPSEEWEEGEYYRNSYPDVYKDFRKYEIQFDKEHPEANPYYNKDNEMNSMWYYGKQDDDFDRLGKQYSKAQSDLNVQSNQYATKNDMQLTLPKAEQYADNRILTKRGPNGMLRGIDKRRNKMNKNENIMKQNTIKLNESSIRKMVAESVKRVLKEMDEFIPHGYKAMNNYGGNEIQISKSGDAARLKFQNGEVSDWLEIEFDEEGVAYVTTPYGQQEKLSEYMRY